MDSDRSPTSVTVRAPAKINLHLSVGLPREDGFHDLTTVFHAVGLYDEVTVSRSDALSCTVTGEGAADVPTDAGNLAVRAVLALAERTRSDAGVAVRIAKGIPVAGGCAGGSADAAAALRALSRLWDVEQVEAGMSVGLGADVPVCVASRPARMRGVGEILDDMPPLPEFSMVLVNPGIGVSTQAVFGARVTAFSGALDIPAGWCGLADFIDWLAHTRNDLEAAALSLCPSIADALAWLRAMPGCQLARMSGSGATCYGVFAHAPEIGRLPAGWWSSTGLRKAGSAA